MSRIATFLTRTAGSQDRADRFGITDFLAYSYLVLGVLIILDAFLGMSWSVLEYLVVK